MSKSQLPMHLSIRCGAKTRAETPCKGPAMPNGRCKFHGGLSTGAPKGNRNAFKHGFYSAVEIEKRREVRKMLQAIKELAQSI